MSTKKHVKKVSIVRRVSSWIMEHKVISLIVLFGAITNIGIIFFSGSSVCVKGVCGLYIGGLHFHDSLWHLALANSAFNTIPFQLPVFAGVPLQGYNYFLDLIIFALTKIGVPAIVSYFKLIPVLFFVLFTYLSYQYAKKINKSPVFIGCFLFFLFFGSSFSYLLSLYHTGSWQSFFYAQAMQSGRMLLNLQYAVSLLPLLGVLILLKRKKLYFIEVVTVGFLLLLTTGFKLYGGVILFFLIAVDFFMRMLADKKYIRWVLNGSAVVLSFLLAILLFYNPFVAAKSGAAFIFSPFALTRPMIEAADHFYMPQLVQARYYLQAVNPHSPRLFAIELLSVALFIFFNAGTRIAGLLYVIWAIVKKKMDKDDAVLLLGIIFSTLLTLTLVQKGTWWNVIQFYGYTLFLMNYFVAMFLYKLFSTKRIFPILIGICIILFTLPTNVEQIRFAFERHATITNGELSALEKLKSLPAGIVLALPTQDTAYISAFSGKSEYVSDEGVLTIIGIDGKERVTSVRKITPSSLKPKVDFIYIKKKDYDGILKITGFRTVFENAEVIIKERE